MSSIQLHVKWGKYPSTENWPWKSSTKEFSFKNTGFIASRGSTGLFLLPISYDVRVIHTGLLSFCKALKQSNR